MNLDSIEGLETDRKRVDNYIATPQIYDNILSPQGPTPFFTNFRIKPFGETVNHLFELKYGEVPLNNSDNYFNLSAISRNNIYLSSVLLELENPDYLPFLEKFSEEDELLKAIQQRFENKEIETLEKEMKDKEFSCTREDYEAANNCIKGFCEKIYESIKTVTNVNTGEAKEIIMSHLLNVIYFQGYLKKGETIIPLRDYSMGEIRQFDF